METQLPHLETFFKAAELGSFTAAAKALRITQSAVSQRVHALERELGKALFDRRAGKVTLTEHGRTLLEYTRRIFDLHREVRQKITGSAAAIEGNLAIGASSVPGEYLLPGILSEFRSLHPKIHVAALVTDSDSVIQEIETGKVQLGFVGRRKNRPNLKFELFARDQIVLAVHPQSPLAKLKSASLRQLKEHPLLLREAGSGLRQSFEDLLAKGKHSLDDFQIALELGSNEALKKAVLKKMGIAVLSSLAMEHEALTGQLAIVEIKSPHSSREMYLVRDARRVLSPPAETFLFFLESRKLAGHYRS